MYGLPQVDILAKKKLVRLMETKGYTPCKNTPGLWRHNRRTAPFSLVVDDFGVKY